MLTLAQDGWVRTAAVIRLEANKTSREPAGPGGIRLIRHGPLALRLRWRLGDLQKLLNEHSFWAQGRTTEQLSRMLSGSQAVVSGWDGKQLVAFGRASSDGVFRAVLWDVVVSTSYQGRGVGSELIKELLRCDPVKRAQRIYLMTTNCKGFYQKLGFCVEKTQQTLLIDNGEAIRS